MNTALKIIDDICEGGKKPNRENILAFEKAAKDLPQVEIPITHHIHGGMYGRESTIKKGFVVTGQIYKFDHFDIMVSGDITVTTDTGESKRLTGFNLIKCMSGKKRAAYTHEDTIWITMHPFSGSNGDDIQDFITVDTFDELAVFKSTINKADYLSFVDSVGISKEDIRTLAETTSDLIPMPAGYESIYIDNSDIEGQGLYSKENIREGSVICPGRINGKRTPAGRYTNHALLHNAEMFFSGDDIELRAIKNIEKGEEITMNYRNVINARYERGEL